MDNPLVGKVCKEEQGGMTLRFVVAAERSPELHDESSDKQFAHKWQFGIDNGRKGGKDGGKW